MEGGLELSTVQSEYLLEMRNIVKVFPGVRALNGVNLKLRSGTVHVVCGENGAGKSTMMKCINGTYVADDGEMFYKGRLVGPHTVKDTLEMGIAMIYQEMNPVIEMTIAENIWLGREPKNGVMVDYNKMYKDTQKLLDELGMPYKAKQKMYELSIAGHQLIEIAKAMSVNASVVIMDEPTSAIGDKEIEVLFKQIFAMRKKGIGILYISHKMDEIFRIADDITIIRDGAYVDSGPATQFDADKLIAKMVGREIKNVFPKDSTVPIGDIILETKNITQKKEDGGRFRNISFQLHAGEILGFSGLVGAGRSEVMNAIFGMDPISSGEVYLNGELLKVKEPRDAIDKGIAMVNEDRRAYGLVLGRSIHHNVSMVNLKKYVKAGTIDDKAITKDVDKMVEMMRIKIANENVEAGTLSGGNQQKVVLGKWMVGDVKVMILDEPTRGIDVGAKAEIHKLMTEFARKGVGIIMISSELPEILGMSDRIVVMREGEVAGILNRDEASQVKIMGLATGGYSHE